MMARTLLCAVVLFCAVEAKAATSRVQAKQAVFFTSNTVSFTWDANTTTKSVIACSVWWSDNTSTIASVVDSVAGTLSDSGLGVQRLNSSHSEQMFYIENITGGTTPTVTATFAAAATPSTSAISCHEISGRATSGALDQKQWNTQNFTGTGTDFITSGTVTTTTNGQYLFCATRAQFATGITAGTNFTADTTGVNQVLTEHLADDQVSAGNIACTFTPAANDGWITGIMTFKASSIEVGATEAMSASSTTATSASVTTSNGSTFIVCTAADGTITTPTDSKSNTYTAIDAQLTLTTNRSRCYRAENATGGASHTFTVNSTGSTIISGCMVELKKPGTATISLHQQARGTDATSPFDSPNITTTIANAALIGFSTDEGNAGTYTHTVGNSFTKQDEVTDGTAFFPVVCSTRLVTATGTYNTSTTVSATPTNTANWIMAFTAQAAAEADNFFRGRVRQ